MRLSRQVDREKERLGGQERRTRSGRSLAAETRSTLKSWRAVCSAGQAQQRAHLHAA